MQMSTSQPLSAAMAVMRSTKYGSVFGIACEQTMTIWSMLATLGRSKLFRRGRISSMRPSPPGTSQNSTSSPTSGEIPSLRNLPRALQV